MAWQPTKPLATDKLSTSYADIQGNFAFLDNMLKPNTPIISLPVIAAAPAAVPNTIQMYVQNDAGLGTPDIFFQCPAGTPKQMLSSNQTAASGWTYLPSGMMLFWGTGATVLTPIYVAFADGGFDNACFAVTVSTTQAGTKNTTVVTGIGQAGFTFQAFDMSQHAASVSFNYIAIGN